MIMMIHDDDDDDDDDDDEEEEEEEDNNNERMKNVHLHNWVPGRRWRRRPARKNCTQELHGAAHFFRGEKFRC